MPSARRTRAVVLEGVALVKRKVYQGGNARHPIRWKVAGSEGNVELLLRQQEVELIMLSTLTVERKPT